MPSNRDARLQPVELFHGQSRLPNEFSQNARTQLRVIGHRKRPFKTGPGQHDVRAASASNGPARPDEFGDCFATGDELEPFGHQTITSTCSPSVGALFSSITSNQPSIASRMFSRASWRVFP